ncbi:diacylglycerol lipase-alpha-like isoform X2 [Apostichopus japonicus]|uniref:diacylglycerol lipase-alpha-like isoform X2 n=1 Tax=Stichopus japonicus TaxID=307972 RepID=UPI003AB79196
MPGFIAFGRRWSVGSDDLVIPGVVMFVLHCVWFVLLLVSFIQLKHLDDICYRNFSQYLLVDMIVLIPLTLLEGSIVVLSMRGTTLYDRPRIPIKHILYTKCVLDLFNFLWAILGLFWTKQWSEQCNLISPRTHTFIVGYCIFCLVMLVLLLVLAWCTYDGVGRNFVKQRKCEVQRDLRRTASRVERNNRQALITQRQYQQKWQRRLRKLYHLTAPGDNQDNAFTEIAEIVSDFFRDIDIVPSDILAGLMLLREDQKKRRRAIEGNPGNDVITFLSGVPITPDTKYLDFTKEDDCSILSELHHYWKYAIASYGCSGYAMLHGSFKCLKLLSCRSSCITSQQRGDQTGRVQACCQCNYTALLELSGLDPNDIVFGTFHSAVSKSKLQGCYPSSFSRDYGLDTEGLNLVGRSSSGLHCEHCPHGYTAPNISSPDGSPACLESSVSFQEEMDQKCMEGSAYPELVPRLQRWLENCLACVCECYCGKDGAARVVTQLHSAVWETPFFVALDHEHKKVILAIRGTSSVSDIVTDLCADTCPIPMEGCPPGFLGHKGMIAAAVYIKDKLQDEAILTQAFSCLPVDSDDYELLIVGHSLGAGAAAVLGILLKPDYPTLQVICFAPPGGLLSLPAAEYTKEFTTSVINGKDVVARVGLSQMELLRTDLLAAIKRSQDPKWSIILGELCCCCRIHPDNIAPHDGTLEAPPGRQLTCNAHPTNPSLNLTSHNLLYPPGNILHIVRNNPKREGLDKKSVGYYVIRRDQTDFQEVLISPVIVDDHMPKGMQKALNKCVEFSKLRKAPTWANKVVSRLCVIGEDVTNEPSHSSGSPPSSCLQMHPIPESTETNTDERHISSHSSSLPNAYSGPQADNSLKLYSGQQKTSTSDYASPGSTLQRGSGSINSSRFASHAYASRPGVVSRRSWGPGNEDLYLFESDSTLVSPCRKCAQAEVERRRRQRLASEESNKSAPMASVESLTSIDTESSSARGSLDIPEEKAKNRLSTHSEGYCYFVFHDMDETEIFPDPKPGNSFVTNAVIESNKRMSWDDSKNISPTLHLKRPESTQLVDRFGNVKGRTSVRDRYTLTYDNGRNSPHTSESQEETPKLRRYDMDPVSSGSSSPHLKGFIRYCPVSSSAEDSDDTLFNEDTDEDQPLDRINLEESLSGGRKKPKISTPRTSSKFPPLKF